MRFSSVKYGGQMFGAALTFRASRKETFSGGSKRGERTEIIKLAASILLAASWRRRRDLNPRGGFIHPTPLAGEPLRPLGYFCKSYEIKKCGGESGIRTHGCFHIAGFQDRFLQPLGHLSTSGLRPNAKKMIPHFSHIVNCRLQYFSAFFPNSALTWSGVQVIKSNKQREPARRKEQMTL